MDTATETICVGRTPGFVFEATLSGCLCFVPANLIARDTDGAMRLREAAYLLTGWARKNALFNPAVQVRLLFPNLGAPRVKYSDDQDVAAFLDRLKPRTSAA